MVSWLLQDVVLLNVVFRICSPRDSEAHSIAVFVPNPLQFCLIPGRVSIKKVEDTHLILMLNLKCPKIKSVLSKTAENLLISTSDMTFILVENYHECGAK